MSRTSQAFVRVMITESIFILHCNCQRWQPCRLSFQRFVPDRCCRTAGCFDRSKQPDRSVPILFSNSIATNAAQAQISTETSQGCILFNPAGGVIRAEAPFWLASNINGNISQKVGGFDRNGGYCQPGDVELGERLREVSYAIKLDQTVQVEHLKFWKTIKISTTSFFDPAWFWLRFIWLAPCLNNPNLKHSSHADVSIASRGLVVRLKRFCKAGALAIAKGACLIFSRVNFAAISATILIELQFQLSQSKASEFMDSLFLDAGLVFLANVLLANWPWRSARLAIAG